MIADDVLRAAQERLKKHRRRETAIHVLMAAVAVVALAMIVVETSLVARVGTALGTACVLIELLVMSKLGRK